MFFQRFLRVVVKSVLRNRPVENAELLFSSGAKVFLQLLYSSSVAKMSKIPFAIEPIILCSGFSRLKSSLLIGSVLEGVFILLNRASASFLPGICVPFSILERVETEQSPKESSSCEISKRVRYSFRISPMKYAFVNCSFAFSVAFCSAWKSDVFPVEYSVEIDSFHSGVSRFPCLFESFSVRRACKNASAACDQ